MLAVIGDVLPLAVGVGISPLPILVVILMLLTPRAKATAAAYLVGWVLGLVLVSVLAAVLAQTTGISTQDEDQTTIAWGQVVFGLLLLLLMGWQQWRTRPAPGQESALPGWLSALDRFTPAKALGVGLLFSAGNPKNLMLTLTAAGLTPRMSTQPSTRRPTSHRAWRRTRQTPPSTTSLRRPRTHSE